MRYKREVKIEGVRVCVIAVYARFRVLRNVVGRIWWRRSRTEM
jgi:hypothetical protein